jgi:glycosyltransferase involved in cell wall biosynthesis
MKVLFWFHGTTHYYNLILSKLNTCSEVEIIYAKPKGECNIGDGVYQTNEGSNFPIFEFYEKKSEKYGYYYFEGFETFILNQKPDIIVLTEKHLNNLLYNKSLIYVINKTGIKTILKSIPFRINSYEDEVNNIISLLSKNHSPRLQRIPDGLRKIIRYFGIDKIYSKTVLRRNLLSSLSKRKRAYNVVDAHLNYVEEAYRIYGSYGVPREKIFITYNSPDTDLLFSIKEKIAKEPKILPESRYRILHLSRLAEWKRVDMLIIAVAHLKDIFPEIELLIIGDGNEMGKLRQMALNLNVSNQVNFIGGVYDLNILAKYISSSSIYVLAGMGGLSINDAMTFGLPVICSVCDGTEKYLVKEGYNGFYFETGNQESLESKIKDLLNNHELCKKMGQNSFQIIKDDVNIHTVVNGYLRAFSNLTKPNQHDVKY